jgi:TetR/AcrR family transcriptional regulator, repressor of fatR-cypB operon
MMEISEKRSHILQQTLELIAERGFHDAPMAKIAKKAGVAAGTIYRYFENKDALITDLYRELEETINATMQEGDVVEQTLHERFVFLMRKLLRYFIAKPLHFRYMEQYYNSPYGILLRRDRVLAKSGKRDIVTNLFEEGVRSKILKDLPNIVLFSLAFGPIVSLIREHVLGFIAIDDALINQITDACWDGIKR